MFAFDSRPLSSTYRSSLIIHPNGGWRFRELFLSLALTVSLVLSGNSIAPLFHLLMVFHALLRGLGLDVVRRSLYGVVAALAAAPASATVVGRGRGFAIFRGRAGVVIRRGVEEGLRR